MAAKMLILLRHAKSSWDDAAVPDFDRPLNARGRRDAPRMGRWLAARGLQPDHVLCSAATRTRETWALVAPAFAAGTPITFSQALYLAEPAGLIAAVRAVPRPVRALLVIGHSPGLEDVAARLVQDGSEAARAAMAAKFPTAAAAVITFNIDAFAALAERQGTLMEFMVPRRLP
jgi:phosphohistidine phosphatase